MADGDLDRRLRQALATVGEPVAGAGARRGMLDRLGRRRARRRLVLASGLTAALVVVAAAAYGISATGGPVRTAAPPSVAPATTSPGPATRFPSSAGVAAGLACVEVGVGGASAGCAGSYAGPAADGSGTFSGADEEPAAHPRSGALAPRAVKGSATAPALSSPEELAVGQSLAVDLPRIDGLVWGTPRLEGSVPAGAPGGTAVLRQLSSTAGPAGTATATFRGAHPGAVDVVADAGASCADGHRSCGGSELVWTLQVTVEGT